MALPDAPDSSTVAKILGDINMDERDLDDAVVSMKQWISKQPHLPPTASEDCWLKGFIIGCKSVERAKVKLDNYFTLRNTYSDGIFNDRDPAKINWNAATNKMILLSGMTPECYKVVVGVIPNQDEIEEFSQSESMKVTYMMMDMMLREHYMSSGVCYVLDWANMCVEFSLKTSMSAFSAACKISQDGYPSRIKTIVIFNAPPLAETFFNSFLKPFFSKKLKERFFIHSEDHTVLSKYNIPVDMLPSDYGGKAPSFATQWDGVRKKLESEREWFLKEGSQSVDESRRFSDNDKMKGTFRKLQTQ